MLDLVVCKKETRRVTRVRLHGTDSDYSHSHWLLGTMQAWNAMRDGRRQQCDTMFGKNPSGRQAPLGKIFDANVLDSTCCVSWCFVDPESCPASSRQEWKEFPGESRAGQGTLRGACFCV